MGEIMATLAQPKVSTPEKQTTAAEEALVGAFEGLLETTSPEDRLGLIGDLRANAVAHGE
jgi:hypothetical protein